jgi:hypothetical protein
MSELRLEIAAAGRGKVDIAYYDEKGNAVLRHQAKLAGIDDRAKAATLICRELAATGIEKIPFEIAAELGEKWNEYTKAEETRRAEADAKAAAEQALDDDPDGREIRVLNSTPAEVRAAAEQLLRSPGLTTLIAQHIERLGVAGEEDLALTAYLVFTSRKLDDPVSLRLHGPSASGKSYVLRKAADLMPPESVFRATKITTNALYHLPPGSLRHKAVICGERNRDTNPEVAEGTRALRELITEKRITLAITEKVGNNFVAGTKVQEGQISFAETTTLTPSEVFAEDANRCITLYTDEREEQTKKILKKMAEASARKGIDDEERKAIINLHQTAQRMLRRAVVSIPFVDDLSSKFPTARVEARRAFGHLLSLIEASAFLHQFQRERDEYGRIVATDIDRGLAEGLIDASFKSTLEGGVSKPAERFEQAMLRIFPRGTKFSTPMARAAETKSKSSVCGWLKELHEVGRVEEVEPSRGNRAAWWQFPLNRASAEEGVI